MSKKVAEFSVDISPSLVNDSLDELFGFNNDDAPDDIDQPDDTDGEEPVDDVDDQKDTDDQEDGDIDNIEPKTKKAKPEVEENNDEDINEDQYKDHSSVSLLALALKDINPDLIEGDVKKDLTPKELLESLQTNINKIVDTKTQEIEERYEGAANYLSLLIKGVDSQTIEYGLKLRQIGDIQLDDNTSEEDLEYIVNQGLIQKGIDDDEERKDMIETLKDKGKLYDRADKTVEAFKKLESEYVQRVMDSRKEHDRQMKAAELETKKRIQAIVEKGSAKGLPIRDKKKLLNSIFNATETIEQIDPSGKKVLSKVSLYDVKQKEFQSDIEQQVAFVQLLLDGFDFTELVKVAKKSVNEDIIAALDKKDTSTRSKSRDIRNPWYDL